MRFGTPFFATLFISLISSLGWGHAEKLCSSIWVQDGELKLNNNEKIIVCGSGSESEAWDHVPLAQAQLHLKAILQNLGYLEPRFEIQDQQLHVWRGSRTRIKNLKVRNGSEVLNTNRKRKVVGEPLTSQKLNEVQAWADLETQSAGYACAQSEVKAYAWNGEVWIQSELKGLKYFSSVQVNDLEGLRPETLDRYQPFDEGDLYDVRKTQLMISRILSDGLFQSAYFLTECRADRAHLTLETSVGKPRILRFGIGASTEEFPFFDLTFRNTRLDDRASSYTLLLHASPREVSLNLNSELYLFPSWSRTFLGPRLRLARESERAFETDSARVGLDIGRNWDDADKRFHFRWGPTLNYTRTIRGIGPDDVTYPSLEASASALTHNYEYMMREQSEGWELRLFYRGQNQGLGSPVDANRYQVYFKHLWNLEATSPPRLVLGTRIESIIVDSDNLLDQTNRELLPTDYRIYLGGDRDLRGFPRQSLNNNQLGYLTSLYLGFELRLVDEWPSKLQPFLLWDWAKLGNRPQTLDRTIYISEGLGLRWASPFGTLRGSAARGRIWNKDLESDSVPESWVYFVSFGQEF